MTVSRFLQGAVCLVLLSVGVFPISGGRSQEIAAAALLFALAIEGATMTRRPSLKAVFIVAYIIVVSRESLGGVEGIESLAGAYYYDIACRYLSAAAGAILLGHLITSSPAPASDRPEPTLVPSAAALVLVAVLGALFLSLQLPKVTVMIQGGRLERFGSTTDLPIKDVSQTLVSGIVQTAGMALPGMIAYLATRVYQWPKMLPFVLVTPIVATQFFLGARFPLLFSVAGFAILMLPREADRRRSAVYLGVAAIAILAASVLMARVRSEGFHQLEDEPLLGSREGPLVHQEECVAWLAYLMRHVEAHGLLHGRSLAGILLFWIPRALWEDKATLIGYWLPRTVEDAYAGGHSVSVTFAGDAFADFGFAGGVLACFAIGLVFGWLDRWAQRQLDGGWRDPKVLVAAVLYGATFFFVRSPDTTLIHMTGIIAAAFLLRFLVTRRPTTAALPSAKPGARPASVP